MLKQGMYIDSYGGEHDIYIVDEQGFYRLDICKAGSEFHVDIDAVEFSLVRRRKTYMYGDKRFYDMYLAFLDKIKFIYAETTTSNEWVNGKYVVTSIRSKPEIGFLQETKTVNGNENSDSIILGGESISIYVVDENYGVKLDPLNFIDYEEENISKTSESKSNTPYFSLSILKSRYDIRHIDKNDCVVADTIELARTRLYAWQRNNAPVKSFDTETTGTDVDMYGDDKLVGIILSAGTKEATYFPFRMDTMDNLPMSFLDELMGVVIREQDKLVAHNKKFDRKVMLKEGYDLRIHWDTMIMSFLINPVIERGAHALKELMLKLDGLVYLELKNVFISEKLINFAVLPKDIVRYYACPDGYNTIRLFYHLWEKLPKYQRALFEKECQLADLKADQEFYGMRVDTVKFAESYRNCNYVLDTLLKYFRVLTKVDGNINSSMVLSDLLYNKMRCKVLARTKTGKPSTSTATIRKLASAKSETPHQVKHDIVDLHGNVVISADKLSKSKYPALIILDKYKEYNKRKTAFYARFERTMKTGRIFFWINQNGAGTGRQSSPMHQLPSELKAVMLSDGDDWKLWGPDYSQVELRMIGFLADEPDLIEMCKDPENDIHRVIGSLISGKEMWEITAEERSEGKRRNFGVVYLISEYGLAGQYFGPGYTPEQVAWCKEQLDAFYKRFKRITAFIRDNGTFVKEHGYMMTRGYNRIRYFKEIFDPDISARRKASLIRQANNLPVQGTSADLLKVAEVNIDIYCRKKGWYDKINGLPLVRAMLSIHDEILISAHKSIPYEEIIKMIKVCMQVPMEGAPPFFVQPAKMDNWAGHSDDSLAIPILYRDKLIEDYDKTGVSVFKTSYFKLNMSEEIKAKIKAETGKTNYAIASMYKDLVSWEFIEGNYTKEITNFGKMHGLINWLESGKTVYCDENYKDLLDAYRESRLKEYMSGLIAEYGTDYKEVCQHVRHPSLTHELIGRYSDEIKSCGKDLTHLEKIEYATKLYIEGIPKTTVFTGKLEKEESNLDEYIEEASALVNLDENGEVVYFDDSDEDTDAYSVSPYDDVSFINEIMEEKEYRVWELADVICIDVQNIPDNKDIDKVIAKAWEYRDVDGFYKVMLLYGNKQIDTGFRVEEIDIEELNDFILSLEPVARR